VKLIVISPESEYPREHVVLAELFGAGLGHYHLRKPRWSCAQLAAWLRGISKTFHPRIVLHSHHELISEFALGGLHDRDEKPLTQTNTMGCFKAGVFRSRAVHDLVALSAAIGTQPSTAEVGYDRVLLSPLFASFSKPGYVPAVGISSDELKAILALPRRAEVIALGGIDVTRIQACHESGFDGVAVLGAVWQASDPVRVFHQLKDALHADAA
jgi:thiamine-phosphate pyrophosphorylase